MSLHAYGVDALFRALAIGKVVEARDDAFLRKVNHGGATGLCHRETLRNVVDGDDLLRPQQDRAANRHLSDRPATPDRDSVRGLNVALHSRLPTGWKDVAEEQHLLVGEASRRYLDVRLIGVGNADIFCLAAGISAREMGVSEQARRRVTKHLVRDVPVPVW